MYKSLLVGGTLLASALFATQNASAQVVEVEQVRIYQGGTFADWVAGTPTGTVLLDDALNNGNPFAGPALSNGAPSLYSVRNLANPADLNAAVSETNGRLLLDANYATSTPNAAGSTGGQNSLGLRLLTDTTNANQGLNQSTAFTAGALFSYGQPALNSQYGVRLTDGYSNSSDVVDLRVATNATGTTSIYFRHQDFLAGSIYDFASVNISAPPAGSFLALGLSQDVAGSGIVHGYWAFTDANGALVGNIHQLGQSTIFNGEDHTQFEIRALVPVPEPETYALMLVGLAMVGTVVLRRKSAK